MNIRLVIIVAALAPAALAPGAELEIGHCLVSIMDEVEAPAQEKGVLKAIGVEEGQSVSPGQLLAQVDDTQAQLQLEASQAQLQAALTRAKDSVEVRYSQAAFEVAKAEYEQSVEINQKAPGTIPTAEVRRLLLTKHRADLQIDKAILDQKVAQMNAQTHSAEVRAAEDLIQRQKVTAPIEGVVSTVYRHAGEWVSPGDPIFRIIRMDRLWVEGFLDTNQFNPEEVVNRPVTVTAQRARGEVVTFTGRIVYVSPIAQAGARIRVKAEVENRRVGEEWMLRPGMTGKMAVRP